MKRGGKRKAEVNFSKKKNNYGTKKKGSYSLMARKFNRNNNSNVNRNNNIERCVNIDRLQVANGGPKASTTKTVDSTQRVDAKVEAGFGFDIDLSGSIWGHGEIDSKTMTGHPVTGAGSGNGRLNFKVHLDGNAEGEAEVKQLLAKAFLKILS